MDVESHSKKIGLFLKKYRYAVLVLLIGIALMLLPSRTQKDDGGEEMPTSTAITTESVDEKLAKILSQIDGAGRVEVMLTMASGEEIIYQTDQSATTGDGNSTTQVETVTVDLNKEETGLIRQVNPPVYLGAIVVCQGADSPSIRLSVVDAVAKITGLGADRISVLKMK